MAASPGKAKMAPDDSGWIRVFRGDESTCVITHVTSLKSGDLLAARTPGALLMHFPSPLQKPNFWQSLNFRRELVIGGSGSIFGLDSRDDEVYVGFRYDKQHYLCTLGFIEKNGVAHFGYPEIRKLPFDLENDMKNLSVTSVNTLLITSGRSVYEYDLQRHSLLRKLSRLLAPAKAWYLPYSGFLIADTVKGCIEKLDLSGTKHYALQRNGACAETHSTTTTLTFWTENHVLVVDKTGKCIFMHKLCDYTGKENKVIASGVDPTCITCVKEKNLLYICNDVEILGRHLPCVEYG